MINGFTNLTNEEMFNIDGGLDDAGKAGIWGAIVTGLVMGLANYADYMTYMNSLGSGEPAYGYTYYDNTYSMGYDGDLSMW